MRTHGEYKAQIDELMGIKSAKPKENKNAELDSLKKKLKKEKRLHDKYKKLYTRQTSELDKGIK